MSWGANKVYTFWQKRKKVYLIDGSILYRRVAKSNPFGLNDVHATKTDLKTVLNSYHRDI